MPKPDVVALTGGYRRTPFMQIGADIYCDSLLMCRVIDRLAPEPPLYPRESAGPGRGRRPMGRLDVLLDGGALHDAAVGRGGHLRRRAARVPEGVRRRSRGDDAVAAARAAARRRCRARRVPAADSRRCSPTADASCSAALRRSPTSRRRSRSGSCAARRGESRRCSTPTRRDRRLVRRASTAFGHGESTPMGSAEAIALAAAQATSHARDIGRARAAGFVARRRGQRQRRRLCARRDRRQRSSGSTPTRSSLARDDARAGRVHVHFPRIGFHIKAAKKELA